MFLLAATIVARSAEDVLFDALDGTRLAARLFRPVGAGPDAANVLDMFSQL
jgi:hypothetical protein